MAAAHSYSLLKAFFVCLCFLFCTAHIFLDISATIAAEFSLESIPRNSPERPVNHSILPSLHHSVYAPTHPHTLPQILPSIRVIKTEGMYVGIINIGNLKFQVYALLSTGNNFNWFLCARCHPCFPHANDIFIPGDSQSYRKVSCAHNKYCTSIEQHACDDENKCKFINQYIFGTIGGIVSSDELAFDEYSENPLLNTFVFGCVNRAHGRFPRFVQGMISLGSHFQSLVNQLRVDIFSVCLPDDESTGYVKFGSAVNLPSPGTVATNLVLPESHLYYVNIDGLTVGNQRRIKIRPSRNTFLVDTGSPMSLVDDTTMWWLIHSFTSEFHHPSLKSMVVPLPGYDLCLHVESNTHNPVFPYMKVDFSVGGSIYIPGSNLFRRVQYNKWCLSIKKSDQKSLLGGDLMANRVFVFNLPFGLMSCSEFRRCDLS